MTTARTMNIRTMQLSLETLPPDLSDLFDEAIQEIAESFTKADLQGRTGKLKGKVKLEIGFTYNCDTQATELECGVDCTTPKSRTVRTMVHARRDTFLIQDDRQLDLLEDTQPSNAQEA